MVSTFTYCTIKPQTKLKKKQSFPLETNLMIVCRLSLGNNSRSLPKTESSATRKRKEKGCNYMSSRFSKCRSKREQNPLVEISRFYTSFNTLGLIFKNQKIKTIKRKGCIKTTLKNLKKKGGLSLLLAMKP